MVDDTFSVGTVPWGVAITPIVYSCQGFGPPMDRGAVTVKKNRALPLKAKLFDHNQQPVTDTEILAPPVIQILYQAGGQSAEDVSDEAIPAGLGTRGNEFEFEIDEWRFNLLTKNYMAPGTYTISMVPGNNYLISPTCESKFVIK